MITRKNVSGLSYEFLGFRYDKNLNKGTIEFVSMNTLGSYNTPRASIDVEDIATRTYVDNTVSSLVETITYAPGTYAISAIEN